MRGFIFQMQSEAVHSQASKEASCLPSTMENYPRAIFSAGVNDIKRLFLF